MPAAAAALLLAGVAAEVALRGLFAAAPWDAAAEARLITAEAEALACGFFPAGFFNRTAAKTPAIDATPAAQAPITRGRVFGIARFRCDGA